MLNENAMVLYLKKYRIYEYHNIDQVLSCPISLNIYIYRITGNVTNANKEIDTRKRNHKYRDPLQGKKG